MTTKEAKEAEEAFTEGITEVSQGYDYADMLQYIKTFMSARGLESMPDKTLRLFDRFFFFGVYPYLPSSDSEGSEEEEEEEDDQDEEAEP